MAAGMLVLVMPFAMHVLVSVRHCLMAVLVTVMSMSGRLMRVLVLVFIFVMAAHRSSLPSVRILSISVIILTTCRTFRQAFQRNGSITSFLLEQLEGGQGEN
jgi:hypothetical protein